MLTNIERMDSQVGELIQMLKADGLYDNTIIFFYSDHGGNLPWTKREILERGTHIPFIIRFPGASNAGSVNADLISAVDFAPTVLSLAGIPIPAYMQGQAFLGKQRAKAARRYVFAARDRMDTEYDRVRMVRDKRYRYLYNYMPEKLYYQNLRYRMSIPMMQEIITLRDAGKLGPIPMSWFNTKPVEELYDLDNDPYELHNLATDPAHKRKLNELQAVYQQWIRQVGDRAATPEREMLRQMWNGQDEAPVTATPQVKPASGGVTLACATKGASIGYRVVQAGKPDVPDMHTVETWDFIVMTGGKTGEKVAAQPVWNVYNDTVVPLGPGDTLYVNAMRIGYKAAVLEYRDGQVVASR